MLPYQVMLLSSSCLLELPVELMMSQTNYKRTSGDGAQALIIFKSPQVIIIFSQVLKTLI